LRVNPTNTPALYKSGWLDPAKTRARLTIDEAIDIAARKEGKVLKTGAKAAALPPSQNVPTAANAGRGDGPSLARPPRDPLTAPEEKKGEGKRKGKGKK
jgi:hypothetical protein